MTSKIRKWGLLYASRAHGRIVVETSFETEKEAKARQGSLKDVDIDSMVVALLEVD